MSSFNQVIIMGNLTRDPVLKYLPNQTACCEFGMAVNKKYRTQGGEEREEVCFVDLTAFGRTAEVVNQYAHKGNSLFVIGELKFDSWEDKQGGGKRSKLSIKVENVKLMPNGDRGGNGGGNDDAPGNQNPQRQQRPQGGQRQPQGNRPSGGRQSAPPRQESNPADAPFSDEQHFEKDDIPF